jgi:hypothetical protein
LCDPELALCDPELVSLTGHCSDAAAIIDIKIQALIGVDFRVIKILLLGRYGFVIPLLVVIPIERGEK